MWRQCAACTTRALTRQAQSASTWSLPVVRHLSRSTRPTLAHLPPRSRIVPSRRPLTVLAQPPPNPPEDYEPPEFFPASSSASSEPTLSIDLTPSAIAQIERAQQQKGDGDLALRLSVESGGCHGYQYKMMVTSVRQDDDFLFEPTGTSAKVVIDSASLPLVNGATIDYATELIGSSFRVTGNPQSKDAGCGCGVSWELKDL
ncbi:hypothetical protein JCM10212_004190 [Sporobolomyces blumeae]